MAAYLDYALQHTEKRVHMVSGVGSMYMGQVRSIRAGDVMIAISFAPYDDETLACVEITKERGAHIVAITSCAASTSATPKPKQPSTAAK